MFMGLILYEPTTCNFGFVRSGNFDVKAAPRSGRSIVENIDKIMEIVESNNFESGWLLVLTSSENVVELRRAGANGA